MREPRVSLTGNGKALDSVPDGLIEISLAGKSKKADVVAELTAYFDKEGTGKKAKK